MFDGPAAVAFYRHCRRRRRHGCRRSRRHRRVVGLVPRVGTERPPSWCQVVVVIRDLPHDVLSEARQIASAFLVRYRGIVTPPSFPFNYSREYYI